MRETIIRYINDPKELEKLYRTNKAQFKREFRALYPGFQGSLLAEYWNERLSHSGNEIAWGTRRDLLFVIIASLIAGLLAKLPAILPVNEEFYYTRNAGFILFPALTAYFTWKNKLSTGKIAMVALILLAAIIFINSLPHNTQSDTLQLSCIHLVIVLWAVTGFTFVNHQYNKIEQRLSYLGYNGDLVVMTTLIVIAGGILSGMTIGLFSLIGFQIEKFYFENIVLFGLPFVPIIGTYLIQTNPQLVGRVSPVIAKIFSPWYWSCWSLTSSPSSIRAKTPTTTGSSC
ncbi:hypothetical protein [Paraflavitalea speifideaquila]|uniref:hypothetical protein n=1 Tax=Paraflavitalea speifideaquila TaxID=3076558 RepID=UPI0028E7A8FD|nr:hypothetical protein [Paraflavitalea speifideiaquila]